MKPIPPDIIAALLTLLVGAQARGWIDVRALEPILRIAVERGYANDLRAMLGQIEQMLDGIERGA